MKKSKILTILMVLVLMFSLVACSTAKNNANLSQIILLIFKFNGE